MNAWLLGLLWLAGALPIHTLLHETAHLVVGLLQGRRLLAFHPWPGRFSDKWSPTPRFLWGWVRFEPHDEAPKDGWMWAAPFLLELGWAVAAMLGAHLSLGAHPLLHAVFLAELGAALIDAFGWVLSSDGGDLCMLIEVTGWDKEIPVLVLAIAWTALLVGGLLLGLPWRATG